MYYMYHRRLVADIMKEVYAKNMISKFDGNVSFKPKHANYFYITAGSVRKDIITHDQILKVCFDKNKTLTYGAESFYKPSRELPMHSYLLMDKMYENKNTFIVHAHPKNILAYMGIFKNRELNTIVKYFPELVVGKIGKNVNFHEAGSNMLATNCKENLIGNSIVGLERHGSMSINSNLEELFNELDVLEYYTDVALRVRP